MQPEQRAQRLHRKRRRDVVARALQAHDDAVADELVIAHADHVAQIEQTIGARRRRGDQRAQRNEQRRETRHESARERPVLAGNRIHADYFLARRFLPRFLSRLSYRLFDVTTFKIEWQLHYREKKFEKLGSPEGIRQLYRGQDPVVGDKHDAYYDVQASIAELAFYRSRIRKL